MRYIGNLLLAVLMLLLVVAAGGCGAKFVLSSFELSPGVCLAGETVTISATLTYNGKVDGEYVAELLVDEVVEQTQTFKTFPVSSRYISFALTKDEPGSYVVQLGKFTATLTVLEVSNFKLSPSEVEVNETVTVNADLRNVTDTEATYHCCLLCQEESVASQDITLAGGATEAVAFTLSQSTPGTYKVKFGSLSASFKVLKPAELKVASPDINPNPVKVGGVTTITMDIRNVGEVEDTYNTSLVIDGEICKTWEVTLAKGAKETLSYSLSKDTPGSYSIQIGGKEATLEVVQPLRLQTGLISEDETYFESVISKINSLKITNETPLDMVAVLSPSETINYPLAVMYVRSGDSYIYMWLPGGSFFLYYTFGEDWDNTSKRFLGETMYLRATEEIVYEQWATVAFQWQVIFDKMMVFTFGSVVLDEDEFPDLG